MRKLFLNLIQVYSTHLQDIIFGFGVIFRTFIIKEIIQAGPRVSAEKVKIICFVFLANFFVLGHTLGNLDLK